MVEDNNFRIGLNVEAEFTRAYNGTKRRASQWLNFFHNLTLDVVINKVAFGWGQCDDNIVGCVKGDNLSNFVTAVLSGEVVAAYVDHNHILASLMELLDLENSLIFEHAQH